LIDAIDGGGHLWAERFDRGVEDIFAVQDEVTGRIVRELVGRLAPRPERNWPKDIFHLSPEMKSCIDECLHCYSICLSTAMGHCLELGCQHTESGTSR
jgi:hypothetical protein